MLQSAEWSSRRSVVSIGTGGVLAVALALTFNAVSVRAQDARCADRSAKGTFNCTINKPVVSRAETVYQNIVFAPGDHVYVNGDGCAQTGGLGDTWKRYVNPGGANSDHLYHGLVLIPTATLAGTDVGHSLTRIKNVVGRVITVTGAGVPASSLVLHLGYEDDDYGDNSYDDPDDGTEDQCKGGNGNDGGPAHVTITICRGVPCGPASSRFPFDLLSSATDPNGFLLNPHWSWQDRPGNHGKIPSTSSCHEFSKYDVGRPPRPNFPDCTDQVGLEDVDTPDFPGINWAICTTPKVPGAVYPYGNFAGHANWFPVTVEGHASWGDHESGDDDYDFSLVSDGDKDSSAYSNDRHFLHVEFDSDETIDHFQSDEWRQLRDAVDNGQDAKGNKPGVLFDGHTIMTGMFGFDGEHGIKSELHPLFAMATTRDQFENGPNDESWLMFVRNRGDEGFCSSQIWNGGFTDYTFRLPWRDGMTSVAVDWNKTQFEGTDGVQPPEVRVVAPVTAQTAVLRGRGSVASGDRTLTAATFVLPVEPPGVYVTFHLGTIVVLPPAGSTWGPPASTPFVDGALHLVWTGAPAGRGTAAGTLTRPGLAGAKSTITVPRPPASAPESDESEHRLETAVSRLPPQSRTAIQRARVQSRPVAVHRLPPGRLVVAGGAAPARNEAAAGRSAPTAGRGGRADGKAARDAAHIRAVCSASNNAPAGLPADVCKAVTR